MSKNKKIVKLAFFVEGQTEQIFVNWLVREILGYDISVINKCAIGGTNVPKQEITRSTSLIKNALFQILIYDCGSDNRVKSEILDNIQSLKENGYEMIIGLRDLYPLAIEELSRLEKGLNFLPKGYWHYRKSLDIIVVVQEIETWFLAETHHLAKVDKRLTSSFIYRNLNFNPFSKDVVFRTHPSKDLNDIYQLVGKSYTKRYWQVQKLVNQLDYKNISSHLRHEITALNKLISIIESFQNKRYSRNTRVKHS